MLTPTNITYCMPSDVHNEPSGTNIKPTTLSDIIDCA